MYRDSEKKRIADELELADKSRKEGLEGRARVCARRAAGVAIRSYLEQVGVEPDSVGGNAFDLISWISASPDLPAEIQDTASHLLVKVNEQFALPTGIDLLAETRWLVDELERLADKKNL